MGIRNNELPDSDGDGVPDSEDQCSDSDLAPTVVISEVDTGIANEVLPCGCTLNDLIRELPFEFYSDALINCGFETGGLTGWTKNVPYGGFAAVETDWLSDSTLVVPPPFDVIGEKWYTSREGNYFLVLCNSAVGANLDPVYSESTVSQVVSVRENDILCGYAAFDYNAGGAAYVHIFDSSGELVATPWESPHGGIPLYWNGPWTLWSWKAPYDGEFQLVYGIHGYEYSNRSRSVALFDAASTGSIPLNEDLHNVSEIVPTLVELKARGLISGKQMGALLKAINSPQNDLLKKGNAQGKHPKNGKIGRQ